MESKSTSKITTTTVINVINGSSSTVIKKTIKRETIENGKIKEITTTVEEITGDKCDDVDKLLAEFDQLPSDTSIETIKIDENSNEVLTTIKKIETPKVEDKIDCKSIATIKTDDGQIKGDTIDSKSITEDKLLDDDKENKSTDQLIVKSVEPINQEKKGEQLTDHRKFNQQCLDKHNYYRSLHGVEPFTINDKLNELAQNWANHLASIGSLSHRPKSEFGENVFWISIKDIDGNKPVDSWYDEIKKYNWDKSTFVSGTGHFTQVIWKNSKQLGIGKSTSSKGTFVVCNYDPPGNFMGKFKENVLPLIKK